MILKTNDAKRYAIYVFYDKDGVVDRYNDVFLKELKKEVSYLLVICNGKIQAEGKERLEKIADEVMVRENIGHDVTAYKEGILKPGFDKLAEYDEVITCNNTMYGPLYPFSEMFSEMAKKDVDFWGITNFHEYPHTPFPIKYDYLPKHVQSFFMVFRKSFVQTEDFQKYWLEFPVVKNYEEAIGCHEAVFTKTFEDKGYRWAVYADSAELEGYTYDPLRDFPRYLIEEKHCPIMKKRSFFHEYKEAFMRSGGEATRDAVDYIEQNLSYDTGLIWENLLRTENLADIKKRMHLNYIVSSKRRKKAGIQPLKLALILHIYYDDLAGYCRKYAESMPEGTDVYITVPSEEKLKRVKEAFEGFPYQVEYRITGNRGRDVAPFIVTCKDVIERYDLICKVHDKRVYQVKPMSLGESWSYKCFENVLKNKISVENIISLFRQQPHLGLLTPPIPNHGPYFPVTGKGEWGNNFDKVKELSEMLDLHVDLDKAKEPIAPLGSIFWFRPEALQPLFAHDWSMDEMPREPIEDDATILHAIERIYPFCAQEAGYYSAWVMVDSYAKVEFDNWAYMNHEMIQAEMSHLGIMPFTDLLGHVNNQ